MERLFRVIKSRVRDPALWVPDNSSCFSNLHFIFLSDTISFITSDLNFLVFCPLDLCAVVYVPPYSFFFFAWISPCFWLILYRYPHPTLIVPFFCFPNIFYTSFRWEPKDHAFKKSVLYLTHKCACSTTCIGF